MADRISRVAMHLCLFFGGMAPFLLVALYLRGPVRRGESRSVLAHSKLQFVYTLLAVPIVLSVLILAIRELVLVVGEALTAY